MLLTAVVYLWIFSTNLPSPPKKTTSEDAATTFPWLPMPVIAQESPFHPPRHLPGWLGSLLSEAVVIPPGGWVHDPVVLGTWYSELGTWYSVNGNHYSVLVTQHIPG